MTAYRNTFSKQERLCSRSLIDNLFTDKHSRRLNCYPLMGIWQFTALQEEVPAQIMFSVSKRNFKKAVDRNRIRRQMRESYRLNKKSLYDCLNLQRLQCGIVILYIAKEKLPYERIDDACNSIIQAICNSAERAR